MSENCKWLHEKLERQQLVDYSTIRKSGLEMLPENGIYFFYEKYENWGHGGDKPRVVRVGTHKDGNFRSRIAEHYLLDDSKMNFNKDNPKPSDRSIFRKNIGRAILSQDSYLRTWEIDFTKTENKTRFAEERNISKEREVEAEITSQLRSNFSFRFIELIGQARRMGKGGLERSLIGTLARCPHCEPSSNWLGKRSPKDQIKNGKLWLVQHLKSDPINEENRKVILEAVEKSRALSWYSDPS
jgi:hypothetical protein